MIDSPMPTREQILAQLMQWLPGVYRARDAQGALRAFLSLFAEELWRIRGTIESHYADHFIDSAQDWVIPYLAELVGTEVLFTGDAAQRRQLARLNRSDVQNTLHWRRQKGTLVCLQDVAQHIGGWGAHAQEMFERVAWLQHTLNIKKSARFALDLRDGVELARVYTPFSQAHALVDLRAPNQRVGWYHARRVCVFEWPIPSHPLRGVTPRAIGGGRYTFHPLGLDTPLIAACDSETQRAEVMRAPGAAGADIGFTNATDTPIRTRDLRAHPAAYVGSPLGFTLREDGILLLGGQAPTAPAIEPSLEFTQLASERGLIAADTTALPPGTRFELKAARLGALLVPLNGVNTPVAYSPGQPFSAQLHLVTPHGTLALDSATPDFTYTPGALPYQPDSGEYHHPVLLLSLTNQAGAVGAFPASEVIARDAQGTALQVVLPPLAAVAPGDSVYLYVAADGSTYFARADHQTGIPDRNPDSSIFGAYSASHLARASEGQRRIRPGHPAGAARWWRLVAHPLCCWDKPLVPPLAPGEVAVDPERGRLAFPAADMPVGELSVDFRFGLTAEIGAGPFDRADMPPPLLTVARTRNADFKSLQAAIDAAPDGAAMPIVIEVLDSAVYEEAIGISNRNFPGGLVIQATALEVPLLRKPLAAPQLFRIVNSPLPLLRLEGLMLAGGSVEVNGAVDKLQFQSCSLQPESVQVQVTSLAPVRIELRQSISGRLSVTGPSGQITLVDSMVQDPAATIEAPSGGIAVSFPQGTAQIESSTILGRLEAHLGTISNSLCYGNLVLADPAASCLRFSRIPSPASAPAAFRCTATTPIFVSIRYGDAGYAHLHPNTALELLRGGEEGGEIGVFASAGLPWRTQNTGLRLNEYTPADLTPVQVRVLPKPRFRRNPRL